MIALQKYKALIISRNELWGNVPYIAYTVYSLYTGKWANVLWTLQLNDLSLNLKCNLLFYLAQHTLITMLSTMVERNSCSIEAASYHATSEKKKRKSSNLSFRTFLTCVHSIGLLYLNVTGQLHRPPHVSGDTNTLHCWGATLTWKQFSLFFWRCWRVDQCSMCSWKMHVLGYPVVSTDKFWGPFSCLFSFVSRNTARYLHWADVVFWVVLELHRLFENSAL